MKISRLKKIRVVVSLLFFTIITLLFVDFSGNSSGIFGNGFVAIQFIPSFIKYLAVGGIFSAGFILIIMLTVLSGRVYCSTICPLGILQDIFSRLSFRKKRKRKFKNSKPHNILRYSILGVSVVTFLSGSIFGLTLLDPYSNYGRIASNIFRPLVIFSNNIIASLFEVFENYSVFPVDFKGIEPVALIFSLTLFTIVFVLSIKKGRIFCNTICPVGTLLGLISKVSVFKIAIDENACKSCGLCEKVCKSGCIDSKSKEIDFSRCVSCFNCFESCPTDGLKYSYKYRFGKNEQKDDESKRDFLKKTAVYLIGLSFISKAQEKIKVYSQNKIVPDRKLPVSPPGSKSIEEFNDKCTACHLCVSACPTQVLQPSFLEYGFTGMLQPRMDNFKGFCNFECNLCGEICPNGAILPLKLEEKKLTQIGKAIFIRDNCVVITQGTDCGACSEHCPTKAVHMVPEKNLLVPEVNDKICIGCGACEFACPTKPYKAIYVNGSAEHILAEKPDTGNEKKKVDLKEEFPF